MPRFFSHTLLAPSYACGECEEGGGGRVGEGLPARLQSCVLPCPRARARALLPRRTTKAAALAGKERSKQGAMPAVKRLTPPSRQSCRAASPQPAYLRAPG